VHQVVTAYMAAGRSGTKAQKNPRRSTRRRQETLEPKRHGSGARRFDPQSIWVGGGTRVRRPSRATSRRGQPQDVSPRHAKPWCRSCLRDDRLVAVESIELTAPRTKLLHQQNWLNSAEPRAHLVEAYEEKLFLAGPQHSACRSDGGVRLSIP